MKTVMLLGMLALSELLPAQQTSEQSGIRFEYSVDPPAPAAATGGIVSVRLTDARSGQPVTGLRPSIWFDRRRGNGFAEESSCADKVKTFAAGGLGGRADLDLNTFLLVTMNTDSTVTFINPTVRFEPSKLESIVELPGRPLDWALTRDLRFLLVTIPARGEVAIIDTLERKLTGVVATGGLPTRVLIDASDRFAWIGLDGSPEIAVLDLLEKKVAARLPAGAGLHLLASSRDGRYVAATSTAGHTVTIYDASSLQHLGEVAVPGTPVPLIWSDAARTFYTASLNSGKLYAIDPARLAVTATVDAVPGIVSLAAIPGGRWLFAASQSRGQVLLIDTSNHSVVARSPVTGAPDQVVTAGSFAYVRSTAENKLTLFDLVEARQGRLQPAEVMAGQRAPAEDTGSLGVASMIASIPGGASVAVASAADQTLYTFAGHKVMGAHRNYRRSPLGLLVLDHGLRETGPGVYSAPVRFPFGGNFDVPVLIPQPNASACFATRVTGPTKAAAARTTAKASAKPEHSVLEAQAGAALDLRFRIVDADLGTPIMGLRDARLLVVRLPDLQQRVWLRELEPGIYGVSHVFGEPGEFRVLASADSLMMGFRDSAPLIVHVHAPARPEVQP